MGRVPFPQVAYNLVREDLINETETEKLKKEWAECTGEMNRCRILQRFGDQRQSELLDEERKVIKLPLSLMVARSFHQWGQKPDSGNLYE